MATKTNYIEKFYPCIISVIAGVLVYCFFADGVVSGVFGKIFASQFLSVIITVEGVLFGFLLTVLSVIMQMNNKELELIKELGRYKDLIGFGKSALFACFLVVAVSLVVLLISGNNELTYGIFAAVWTFSFVLSILNLHRFVRVFFLIAKSA